MRKIFKKLAFFFVAILSLTVSSSYSVKEVNAAESGSYVKVTEAPTDWSGDYLIVYEAGNVAFDGGLTTLDAVNNTIPVTINNEEIAADDETNAAKFTVAKSGSSYTVKSASGYYIGQTANSNGLKSSTTTTYTNTLSISDGIVNISCSSGPVLKFNSAKDQMRFRYYKSGQQSLCLYKLVEPSGGGETEEPEDPVTPIITLNTSNVSVKVGETATVNATINAGCDINGIAWTSSNDNVAKVTYTVDGSESIATIEGVAAGNATITASIEGGESKTVSVIVESNSSQDPVETAEVTIDLTAQNFSNQQEVTKVSDNNNLVTVTFDKGTNNNTPKYFTSGSAVRVYGGGYFVVSSKLKISKIEITFGSSDGSNAITTDCGTYSNGTWTGESNDVKFTVGGSTGNRRIAKFTITYIQEDIIVPPSVELTEDEILLNVNDELLLEKTITNEDNVEYSLTWSSSDDSIVSVDQTGIIKCLKTGVAYITLSLVVEEEIVDNDVVKIIVSDNRYSYKFVTNISELTVGSKIVIAASDSDYAMSTEQKTNNRGQTEITKVENNIIFSSEVEVFTLVKGNTDGTFAFKTDNGYLYAAGNADKENYLRTETELSDNSSWIISITDGITSIVAQGENTRNVMQYNQSNSLFSCYASTTTTMKPISLYKLTYNVEPLKTTNIDAQLNFDYKVEDNIHTRNMYAKETVASMDSSKNYASALGLNEEVFNVTGTADAANNYPMIKSESYIKISGNTTLNSTIIVSSNYVIKSIEFTALLAEYDISKVSILVNGTPVEVNENKFEINAKEFVITTNQDSGFRFNNLSITYQEKDENTYSDFSNFRIKFTANIPETLDSLFKDNISHYGFEVTIEEKTISKEIEFDHQSSFSLVLNNISAYDVKISVKAYIVCNGNRIYFNTKEYSVIDMVNKYLEDTSKLTQEQIDALTAFKASLEN